jgi:hypothetical protein
MRRFALYLSVALLAFGMGSLIVFKLYFKPNEQSLIDKNEQAIENVLRIRTPEPAAEDLSSTETFNGYHFLCEDKQLKFFWLSFLKEKSVQKALPKKEYNDNVVYNCSHKLKIFRIDLNDDGNDEYNVALIDSGICSSKSNCPRMIYEQNDGEFNQLLFNEASLLVELGNNRTKGYQDLNIVFNTGPGGGYIENYKFDGKRYKLENCYSGWSDDKLKRMKCRSL